MIIENHFTIDKNYKEPNHKASTTPAELKEWVLNVRHAEMMMGNGHKDVTPSNQINNWK